MIADEECRGERQGSQRRHDIAAHDPTLEARVGVVGFRMPAGARAPGNQPGGAVSGQHRQRQNRPHDDSLLVAKQAPTRREQVEQLIER